MLKDKLTLIIHSCQKFSDLWDAHFLLLDQNWPDRGIRTILATDEPTDWTHPGVEVFSAGTSKELSERTKTVMGIVETEYVLITLDDYFPVYPIKNSKIEYLVGVMDAEHLDYIRMFHRPWSFKRLKNYHKVYEVNIYNDDYAVNLYSGIWRRSFAAATVREPLNAWKYEVSLTPVARELKARCAMSKNNDFPIMDVVRKGKLLTKANNYFKKHPIYHGNREVMKRKDEIWIEVKTISKFLMPTRLVNALKSLMRKMGMEFFSE